MTEVSSGPRTALCSRFITLEGGEGAGKSTLIGSLAEHLTRAGQDVVVTREPGGTPGAEAIRAVMLSTEAGKWDAMTELLLATAARRAHVEQLVLPALKRGAWVLCDRFVHSTLAYQGGRDDVDDATIVALHDMVIGAVWPERTLILDLDPDMGLARASKRDGARVGRFEEENLDFHHNLRARFQAMADADVRCLLLDAAQLPDQVLAAAISALQPLFKVHGADVKK